MERRTEIQRINRIIFTDPGIDDASALLYLKKHTEKNDRITAIASSFGNVSEAQAFKNINQLHQIFGLNQNWVVMRGPNRPLNTRYSKYAKKAVYKGNGKNGLWNTPTPLETPITEPPLYITGDIGPTSVEEIFSLSPLTVPVLLQKRGLKPDKVLIMGGSFSEGNVRPINRQGEYAQGLPRVAEWNFFKDALAAKEYFEKYAGTHVWVVTKDACMVALLSAQSIIKGEAKPTIEHRFMKKLLEGWSTEYARINPAVVQRGLMLADLIAVISYRNPEIAEWKETGINIIDQIGPELGRSTRSLSNPSCKVSASIKDSQMSYLFEAINDTVFGTV